jgi:hypothetical protein
VCIDAVMLRESGLLVKERYWELGALWQNRSACEILTRWTPRGCWTGNCWQSALNAPVSSSSISAAEIRMAVGPLLCFLAEFPQM